MHLPGRGEQCGSAEQRRPRLVGNRRKNPFSFRPAACFLTRESTRFYTSISRGEWSRWGSMVAALPGRLRAQVRSPCTARCERTRACALFVCRRRIATNRLLSRTSARRRTRVAINRFPGTDATARLTRRRDCDSAVEGISANVEPRKLYRQCHDTLPIYSHITISIVFNYFWYHCSLYCTFRTARKKDLLKSNILLFAIDVCWHNEGTVWK